MSQFQLISFNQLKIETVLELIACGKANHKLVDAYDALKWQEFGGNVRNVWSDSRTNVCKFISMVRVKYFSDNSNWNEQINAEGRK